MAATATQSTVEGTLRFMSPEAMRGIIDRASDVYAYGMTLYEIFTNEPPFMLVPDFVLKSGMQGRLVKPTDAGVVNRGLTEKVWALVWETSDPEAAKRPEFDVICDRMEALVNERSEVLRSGAVVYETPDSDDDDFFNDVSLDAPAPPRYQSNGENRDVSPLAPRNDAHSGGASSSVVDLRSGNPRSFRLSDPSSSGRRCYHTTSANRPTSRVAGSTVFPPRVEAVDEGFGRSQQVPTRPAAASSSAIISGFESLDDSVTQEAAKKWFRLLDGEDD